jgi:histidyl-tRNA synthetase
LADKAPPKTALRAVRGMHDHFGISLQQWKWAESEVSKVLSTFGYEEIRTPVLEHIEVFSHTVGQDTEIVEKQMYQVQDRAASPGDLAELLVLRPEGTAAFIRSVVENGLHLQGGVGRYYYYLPMFRHERPQKGRLRQFHQFGAELILSPSPEADAEVILLLDQIYKNFGLQEYTIRLNSLGTRSAREAYKTALVNYFSPHVSKLDETAQKKFLRTPLRILDSKDETIRALSKNAPRITEYLEPASKQHYETLKANLRAAGVKFEEDPTIVRGLDYYCETTFEFTSELLGAQSALGGGGRYDGLSERFGVAPFPAIGWALGMERLMIALEEKKLLPGVYPVPTAFFAPLGLAAYEKLLPLSIDLKRKGVAVLMSFEKEKNLKWLLKQADRSQAKFALIVGDNELASGNAVLKDLKTGEQTTVALTALESELLRRAGK